jgi:outer membrane protein assembly factor BamB
MRGLSAGDHPDHRADRQRPWHTAALPAAIGLLLGVVGCASMQAEGILVPPERNEMPEYPARTIQRQVLSVRWRVAMMEPDRSPVEAHHHGQPAIAPGGQRVFAGAHDGSFYCLDAASGRIVWRKLVDGPFDSAPLVAGGVVYAGSGGGALYAWRAADGELLWSHREQAGIYTKPVLAEDALLVATDANSLVALDALSGERRWSYSREVPGGRFQVKGVAKPLVVDGAVFMGFSDGSLAKLSLADGSVLAVRKLAQREARFTDVDGDPLLVAADLLLVGTFSEGVLGLDPADLSRRWQHEADGASGFARSGERVYYSTADSKVEALRLDRVGAADSALAWRFDAQQGALSRPVLAGPWLLVSSSEHSLLVLDRSDGHLLQVFNPGKGSVAPPAVGGGRIYWISNGQVLYCMDLAR